MKVGSERIVTIFGGSKCGENSSEYAAAHRVGELLAEEGFTICTGGYAGVRKPPVGARTNAAAASSA
jgi:predicted Rossmann-fold nucleotide-binding protein